MMRKEETAAEDARDDEKKEESAAEDASDDEKKEEGSAEDASDDDKKEEGAAEDAHDDEKLEDLEESQMMMRRISRRALQKNAVKLMKRRSFQNMSLFAHKFLQLLFGN